MHFVRIDVNTECFWFCIVWCWKLSHWEDGVCALMFFGDSLDVLTYCNWNCRPSGCLKTIVLSGRCLCPYVFCDSLDVLTFCNWICRPSGCLKTIVLSGRCLCHYLFCDSLDFLTYCSWICRPSGYLCDGLLWVRHLSDSSFPHHSLEHLWVAVPEFFRKVIELQQCSVENRPSALFCSRVAF